MKLATTLSLVLSACILVVLSGTGAFWLYRELQLVETEAREQLGIVGSALLPAYLHDYRTEGREHATTMMKVMVKSLDASDEAEVRWAEEGAVVPPQPQVKSERGVLTLTLPLRAEGVPMGAIVVTRSLHDERAFVWESARYGIATLVALGLVLQLAAVLAGRWLVGRPLAALVEQTQRISRGDLDSRLRFGARHELDVVAAALNSLSEDLKRARERVATEHEGRVALLEQMRHADRLATVGKLAAGVAHELGTPLTVVLSRARMISTGQQRGAEAERSAQVIAEQAVRISAIVRQLLDFARREGEPKVRSDVGDLARGTLELLEPMAKKRGVALKVERDGPQEAVVEPNQLGQALANLVVNGLQAMHEGGTLKVAVATTRARPPPETALPEGDYLCIAVEDEGSGIAREQLPHVFDPFFTTKPVGEGTGLGLSVAYGIAREHGGWIDARSEPGRGSCFSIHLPPAERR